MTLPVKIDGFAKSPYAAFPFIPRPRGVQEVRLGPRDSGALPMELISLPFEKGLNWPSYEFIKIHLTRIGRPSSRSHRADAGTAPVPRLQIVIQGEGRRLPGGRDLYAPAGASAAERRPPDAMPGETVRLADGSTRIVPHGSVYVLGDNREHSLDSRTFGFVPLGDITAKVRQVYFSRGEDGIRWNRIGKTPE